MELACKSCERGLCDNDPGACRDRRNCACCGEELPTETDFEEEKRLWRQHQELLDSYD